MNVPLFRRLLGDEIDQLPLVLRQAHDAIELQHWAGSAVVTRSKNPIAQILCRMMKLPAPGNDVPIAISFERIGDVERWRRTFAGRTYQSDCTECDGLLIERMGPATNIFRISSRHGHLHFDLIGFRFLGIPIPSWARPHCHALESSDAGKYVFDVPVSFRWLGFAIRYTGRMEHLDG